MRRFLFKLLLPLPVIPPMFLWTVAALLFVSLNLLWRQEIWPHTPGASPVLEALLITTLGCLIPQGMSIAWRWLSGHPGPRWMKALLQIGLLPLLMGAALLALVCLIMAVIAWLQVL
ncbi:hypothetical protein [Hymenobacter sp. BT491]|uniref:hypothetical protein n=1 Tax=Hymenobacter sp. BT491 TaxID=2766779 RepID=UPI0016534892|nr:hypothetical protein [Hymenobacter sp. BT491]MBC6990628.1 hypothetical protein [Hymenobacter sp. BT491]